MYIDTKKHYLITSKLNLKLPHLTQFLYEFSIYSSFKMFLVCMLSIYSFYCKYTFYIYDINSCHNPRYDTTNNSTPRVLMYLNKIFFINMFNALLEPH